MGDSVQSLLSRVSLGKEAGWEVLCSPCRDHFGSHATSHRYFVYSQLPLTYDITSSGPQISRKDHRATRIQRHPDISLQSPTPGQAYRMDPMKCVKHRPHLPNTTERTYHTPGPINRHNHKRTAIPDLLATNVQRPELLVYKPILSTPLQSQRPALVSNQVTNPVILTDVNERINATVQ